MVKFICVIFVFLIATASNAQELRGVWNAGLQGSSPNNTKVALSWTLEAIGEIGRLTAEGEGWGAEYDGPRIACTYFVPFSDQDALTAEPGLAPACPAAESIRLRISGYDVTVLESPGLEVFGDMQLRNIAAHVPAPQLAATPPNFDVLGVGPRQTLAEVEENLLGQRGWALTSSRVTTAGGSTAGRLARVYLATDQTVTGPTGIGVVPVDAIVVAYESVIDAKDADAPSVRAVVVQRTTFYFDAGEQVAVASLNEAVIKKYGVSSNDRPGAGDGNRDFDRDGNIIMDRVKSNFPPCFLDENNRRVDIVQLKWSYDRPWEGRAGEIWGYGFPGCGGHVDVSIREQSGTGAVDELRVTLEDRDLVLNSEWTFIEAQIAPKIRTAAGLADAGGSEAPEL